MKTREQIKAGYSKYPDHILKHVVSFNEQNINGAPNIPVVREKRLVASVARELLTERGVA